VHTALRYLEHRGVTCVPRVADTSFSPDGFETLTYIEGDAVPPTGLTKEGGYALGELLRAIHDGLRRYQSPLDPNWMPSWMRTSSGLGQMWGHCDVAPWNLVCKDGIPIALIDWDSFGRTTLVWELAQAIWLNAQLFDDDVVALHGLPLANERMKVARAICDGYGVTLSMRRQLPDAMIEVAIRTAAQEATDAGVTETGLSPAQYGQLGGGTPFTGHQLTWAMAWRIRSARWMLQNRSMLEEALVSDVEDP
jgi:hypothetical protein